jgi:hypothetical protein
LGRDCTRPCPIFSPKVSQKFCDKNFAIKILRFVLREYGDFLLVKAKSKSIGNPIKSTEIFMSLYLTQNPEKRE